MLRSFSKPVQNLFVLAPVASTYLLLWLFGTPIPWQDDYWHIFAFVLDYVKAPSGAAKLHVLLWTQVGPYKLIFEHSLVALELSLFHHVNMSLLILLGNLSVLGILMMLWKEARRVCRQTDALPLFLLPITALLFCLNYADTLDWAISGLQQPTVILFSLASLYFLSRQEKRWTQLLLACAFGILACATYANGMFVWPTGLLVLCLERPRRWKHIALWCFVALAGSAAYLYHYQTTGLSAPQSIRSKLLFFVMFCGGVIENQHHWPVPFISVPIGIAILFVLALSFKTKFHRRSMFLFASGVWILLTAAEVANARIALGLDLSLASRYKLYCDLLLIICYVYLLDRVTQRQAHNAPATLRRFLLTAIAASISIYLAGAYAGVHFFVTRRARAEAALRNFLAAPDSASPLYPGPVPQPGDSEREETARQELNELIRLHIYTPPAIRGQEHPLR